MATSSWYADEAWYSNHWGPWFQRGGSMNFGTNAGIFAFDGVGGGTSSERSFRIVLGVR
jgi:hypothetical protein